MIDKLPFLATVTGAIYDGDKTINWVKETRVKYITMQNAKTSKKNIT